MRNRIRWLVLVVAGVVAIGGLWLGRTRLPAQAAESVARTSEAAAALRSVEVVAPERRTMSRRLDVPATIEAFERADLCAKVSGYVSEVRVDIGDRVRAGDVLVVLDVPEMADELRQAQATRDARAARVEALRARVRQAELAVGTSRAEEMARASELALQEATARRKEQLFAQRAIPEQELDEIRSQLAVAQAQVEIARAKTASAEGDRQAAEADVAAAEADVAVAEANVSRLKTLAEYAQIKAPFDGVVAQRHVDRGALVQAATSGRTMPLLTLQRYDLFRIFIEVPESDVAFVHPGVAVIVEPYGLPDAGVASQVTRIATALNPSTRTMRTEIDLPSPDGRLYDGMYAQVTVELDQREQALTIPAAALLVDASGTYVFTAHDGQAARTPIKTGLDDGIRVEVTAGLNDSALVIVAGKGLVSDGMPVKAVRREHSP